VSANQLTDDKKNSPEPTIGKLVWVQCRGFRCLAFRDSKGKWRTFHTGEELSGAVTIAGN